MSDEAVAKAAKVLTGDERAVILIGGAALTEAGLAAASRVASATGATLLCETFPARLPRAHIRGHDRKERRPNGS